MIAEQARKIRHRAIPEWAEGIYYNSGMFSEILVYHDDESIYIEHNGKLARLRVPSCPTAASTRNGSKTRGVARRSSTKAILRDARERTS